MSLDLVGSRQVGRSKNLFLPANFLENSFGFQMCASQSAGGMCSWQEGGRVLLYDPTHPTKYKVCK